MEPLPKSWKLNSVSSAVSRVSIGGLIERWYYVIEGWSNPGAWTILDARVAPQCAIE